MIKKDIDFFKDFEIRVDVYEDFEKKKKLNKNSYYILSVMDDGIINIEVDMALEFLHFEKEFYEVLYCVSEYGNGYTIFDCKALNQWTVFSQVIMRGLRQDLKLNHVQVMFDKANSWMNNTKMSSFNKDKFFSKETKGEEFDVSIEGKGYSVYCKRISEVSEGSVSTEITLSLYTIFGIKSDCDEEINYFFNKINELKTIISLLIGYPINILLLYSVDERKLSLIKSLSVVDGFSKVEKPRMFVPSVLMFKNNKWDIVLNNYFLKCNDNKIWDNLAGMLSFEGFFEYRIMSYVILLDKYTDMVFKSMIHDKEIGVEGVYSLLGSIFDRNKESKKAKNDLKRKKRNNNLYFRCRYHLFKHVLGEEIFNIIGLEDVDFDRIKKFRDAIAHGDEPIWLNDDAQYEYMLSSKIGLLLRYKFLLDVGFTHNEFLRIIRLSINSLISESNINKTALDLSIGDHSLLFVNEKDFEYCKKNRLGLILSYNSSENAFEVERDLVEKFRGFDRSKFREKGGFFESEILEEFLNIDIYSTVAFSSKVYVSCNEKTSKLSSCYILDCPEKFLNDDLLYGMKRFDRENSVWLKSDHEKRYNS